MNKPTPIFARARHRLIAQILDQLDTRKLLEQSCYFGGGTAIAMRFGEYRESVDIDFLVSRLEGYRELRTQITGQAGLASILRPNAQLASLREIRADQYGIRTIVSTGEIGVKFEIVFEARISLEAPSPADCIQGIACLTAADMLSSKLLANSDRWNDPSVFSRDLIDIAMQDFSREVFTRALAKAEAAYGISIKRDVLKALERFRQETGYAERCMTQLQMNLPKALLWKRLQALEKLFR